jgi:hypothetical protein
MRKALIVGIDYYEHASQLAGCVNDAYAVKSVLERHANGSLNFGVNLMVATDSKSEIHRKPLKNQVAELFKDDSEIAFFYFSGHGHIESTGGYLITSECEDGDDGFSLDELLMIVNTSPAQNKIIVLDCCHSGIAGSPSITEDKAFLNEGVTVLTASAADQYSVETDGSGVFTTLFVDALNGGAANLVGDITPGSIYAHIDQALGPWEQRPLFKTNTKLFISLREVQPPIALDDLKRLTTLFSVPAEVFKLDPSFEPTSGKPDPENTEKFSVLQNYNHVNLVQPIDEDHMYYAAINSTGCRLTALGVHYWNLVYKGRL